ncbi:MAG: hypothetical protein CMH52_11725 [Myxococcales bacterium]|nr:hypothetical protein [Myxococcales bacterium]
MTGSVMTMLLIGLWMPLKEGGLVARGTHWSILKKLHEHVDEQNTIHAASLRDMKRRTRLSALLPILGLTYRFVQDDWNRTTVEDSQGLTDLSVDNSIRLGRRYQFGFELTWRPSQLVYHSDELRIDESRRRLDARRQAFKTALTDAFLNWLNASPSELISPSIEALRSAQKKRRHWSLVLNALTQGAFSRLISKTSGPGEQK